MREPAWGLLIVIYLFFGGLSAGAMMLSSLAHLFGRTERHHAIARAAAFVAPLPVIVGTAMLVFDLGRPFFFWKLFLALKPFSPMWIGSWLLTFFSLASLAYAYLMLPAAWQKWFIPRADAWRRGLAIAGLPLGLSVAVYTAVLLGVLVARPLWNTPLLALLFVLSALSSAAALLLIIAPRGDRHLLSIVDVGLIVAEVLVLVAILTYGLVSYTASREAVILLAVDFGWSFWLGVMMLGLLAPLAVEWWLLRNPVHSRLFLIGAAVLVLLGGFLLRYVVVYAGQLSALA